MPAIISANGCESQTFEEKLNLLVTDSNLPGIFALRSLYSLTERSRFLWAWPSDVILNYLKKEFVRLKVTKILSVGCGSGLLEWIIQQYCDVQMHGVELDRSWWSSTYSPRTFIPLKFSTNDLTPQHLSGFCAPDASSPSDNKFALLFCYFNNGVAFRDYISNYKGDCVLIIGPGPGIKTYTDPEPFRPNFGENHHLWRQISIKAFDMDGNFISIWTREI